MIAAGIESDWPHRAGWSVGSSTYDAVHAKNKRHAPTGILRWEDNELPPTERRKLLSATRTLHRNFSVAAWMIRKHLDYVSTFSFQARTGNNELDDSLERLVRWWSQPVYFDVTGRFGLQPFTRPAATHAWPSQLVPKLSSPPDEPPARSAVPQSDHDARSPDSADEPGTRRCG